MRLKSNENKKDERMEKGSSRSTIVRCVRSTVRLNRPNTHEKFESSALFPACFVIVKNVHFTKNNTNF